MINIPEEFIGKIFEKYPDCSVDKEHLLAAHTTMRVGGKAALAIFPKSAEQLCFVLSLCSEYGIRHAVLGHGSNVVCSDEGYNGIVIRTERMNSVSVEGDNICADCGASLNALARAARDAALTGAEFLYGIPGSVGGACYMNAGAYGGQISDICVSVTAYDEIANKVIEYSRDECGFGYRQSIFHNNDVLTVLSCRIKLEKGCTEAITARMEELILARKTKQPLEYPSAGSFFKRCEGRFTAQLIDESGLKGLSVGGAQISEKHAGFLINRDNATCADIMALSDKVRAIIKERYGLDIEREVEYLE
jgi:UDP-N-acetylmuramate dehydrogenase